MSTWRLVVLGLVLAFWIGPTLLTILISWRANGRFPIYFQSAETPFGFVHRVLNLVLTGYGVLALLFVFWPDGYRHLPTFSFLQTDGVRWTGAMLGALGLAIAWIGQRQMGPSWRFGFSDQQAPPLVTTGFFRICRNPIYLGTLAIPGGLFLIMADALTFCCWMLGVVLIGVLVRLEEQYLRSVHGPDYAAYVERTGRFFPKWPGIGA